MKTASSIDPREVAYYERLAHTWWDRHGLLWPIHTLNTLRVRYLERQIAAHFGIGVRDRARFAGLRVLDIGCGGGVLSEALARLGAEVTGIDVAERNIRVARHHAATSDLDNWIPATAEPPAVERRLSTVSGAPEPGLLLEADDGRIAQAVVRRHVGGRADDHLVARGHPHGLWIEGLVV